MKQDFLEILQETKKFLIEEKKRKNYIFSNIALGPISPQKPSLKITPFPAPTPIEKDRPTTAKQMVAEKAPVLENPKPIEPSFAITISPLKHLIEKACPHIKLKDTIPSDKLALLRKNAWKCRSADIEVLILEMSGDLKQKQLLTNMGTALSSLGKKVQVIDAAPHEKQESWDVFTSLSRLSFIIAPPLEHWKAPLLQSQVRLNPATQEAHLGKAKLLFLPPIENLLSDLQLKLKVWKWLITALQA